MLTGKNYWCPSSHNISALFEQIMHEELESASARAQKLGVRELIPDGFDDWFTQCVTRNVPDRFSMAGDAVRALDDFVTSAHIKPVWSIALPNEFSGSIESVIGFIRAISDDAELVLKRTVRGSLVLLIEGSRRAYESVRALFEQHRLPKVFGVTVDDVQWRGGPPRTSSELFGLLGRSGDKSGHDAEAQGDSGPQLFISYAQRDSDLCDELLIHLSMMRRQGLIREWYDRLVSPGQARSVEVLHALDSSELFIPLVSAEFIASDDCFRVEMDRALEKHGRGEAQVIPVIVRACDWNHPPLDLLRALPTGAKPVTSWPNRDEAWLDVTRGIRQAVVSMKTR